MNDIIKKEFSSIKELFFNELLLQLSVFTQTLAAIENHSYTLDDINQAVAAAHTLKGGCKLTKQYHLEQFADALEKFFADRIKNEKPNQQQLNICLKNIHVFFDEIKKLNVDTLDNFLNDNAKTIDLVISQLNGLDKIPSTDSAAASSNEHDTIDKNMLQIFCSELESQVDVLNNSLVILEQDGLDIPSIILLMRAAHSIKGAARAIGLTTLVELAHAIEDYFNAVQKGALKITSESIDILLRAVDMLSKLSRIKSNEYNTWLNNEKDSIAIIKSQILQLGHTQHTLTETTSQYTSSNTSTTENANMPSSSSPPAPVPQEPASSEHQDDIINDSDRYLRLSTQHLNRLMGLAGESLVESRWISPFSESLLRLKHEQDDLASIIERIRESTPLINQNERLLNYFSELKEKVNDCRHNLSLRLAEFELFFRRYSSLSDRLYREVIDSRMRPFADGVVSFPRMVRDLARQLGKKVHFEIIGKSTPVDRDILEKLETPINHLLHNALDHGIESPEERIACGKSPTGHLKLQAQHVAGMLSITISDDGRGVNFEQLRKKTVESNLLNAAMAAKLTDNELLDFIFLPGFSTAANVTQFSGRGVGLTTVHNTVQEVGGIIQAKSVSGKGMSFRLQLPLTLSVIRALLVEISKEIYAFPLSRVNRVLYVQQEMIEVVEHRQYFNFESENIGLVKASQIMNLEEAQAPSATLPIVVLSDQANLYGIVVDKFLGEKELVVQEMDHLLGKIPNISTGAFMEDGSPILILDIDDLIRSLDKMLSTTQLNKLRPFHDNPSQRKKRVLVVDDSITVREVEMRLLANQGYDVDTAINGVEAWNAVRMNSYDLLVTDVDMPRMNGIELVKRIKNDARLKNLPVLIVSYKEREEDRIKGLEAGANYYLTKSSFHDETLLNAVIDLIGMP